MLNQEFAFTGLSIEMYRDKVSKPIGMFALSIEQYQPIPPKRIALRGISFEIGKHYQRKNNQIKHWF
jgi:hypothetical protein